MRLTQYFLPTLREAPSDADTVGARLMIRAGMIRKIASGLYDWLPIGYRVLKKVETIVRKEMNAVMGQEVWLPHMQPRDLWEKTGRWQIYGKELIRFKDRKDADFCLAPTAEEVITDLVRRDVRSYRQLPLMLYQFGTKFRDEIRPRFGVMRAREFYMKDAYSFHADEKDAERYYQEVFRAYGKIFSRCGIKFRPVEAETGAIGGSFSHEFIVMAETGEEEIVTCESCGYAANVERAECSSEDSHKKTECTPLSLEEVSTPKTWTVADVSQLLEQPKTKFIKTLFYVANGGEPVVALVRGDHELNESKLQRLMKSSILEKAKEEVYQSVAGCQVGYAGPVGLKGKCRLIADESIRHIVNGISGANKKDTHLININPDRDYRPDSYGDIRFVVRGDTCPRCGKKLVFSRGIEVGHCFKLGTKYSESMQATFLDRSGKMIPFQMGCYGIGVSRVVAATIEQSHDDDGIIWPLPLAPFEVVIVPVNWVEKKTKEAAERMYADLTQSGYDVLLDDRDERAGVKFKDADLIGVPIRVTISEKKLALGKIEVKKRSNPNAEDISVEDFPAHIKKMIQDMRVF